MAYPPIYWHLVYNVYSSCSQLKMMPTAGDGWGHRGEQPFFNVHSFAVYPSIFWGSFWGEVKYLLKKFGIWIHTIRLVTQATKKQKWCCLEILSVQGCFSCYMHLNELLANLNKCPDFKMAWCLHVFSDSLVHFSTEGQFIESLTDWWFGTWILCFHILRISSSQLTNIGGFKHYLFSIIYGIVLPID